MPVAEGGLSCGLGLATGAGTTSQMGQLRRLRVLKTCATWAKVLQSAVERSGMRQSCLTSAVGRLPSQRLRSAILASFRSIFLWGVPALEASWSLR